MALYWHFPGKDKLIAAVAARIWGEMRIDLDRAAGGYRSRPTARCPAARCSSGSWAPLMW